MTSKRQPITPASIAERRERLGLSQEACAEAMGIAQGQWSRYERGLGMDFAGRWAADFRAVILRKMSEAIDRLEEQVADD